MKAPFAELVEPHRARLRLHCYRMLASTSDAEDTVQETFVRAYRSRDTLSDDALVRPWLFRIATRVCLDELANRSRRARGPELGPPCDPDAAPAPALPETAWIEPIPGSWTSGADPSETYSVKESVALAFVAALQVLTPLQRAVLLLRDVVEQSAEETSATLGITVSSVNGALHRAREALTERVGPRSGWSPDRAGPIDEELLRRYLRVWESSDLSTIVELLHEDVTLSMPPSPTWISGRADVVRFFGNRVRQLVEDGRLRTVATEANGRPTVAFYRRGDDPVRRLFALHVLEPTPQGFLTIDHFMAPRALAPFVASGLPEVYMHV